MRHLSERDLNALLDQRLGGEPLWRAQRHLESCARCRDAFADLTGQRESLERALAHDPGAAYFDKFADRVVERIVAEEATGADFAPLREQALRDPIRTSWWNQPRAVVAAGTVVAVLAGAGLVLVASRHTPMSGSPREREAAMRALRAPANAVPESQAVSPSDEELRADREGARKLEADRLSGAPVPAMQAARPESPPAEAPTVGSAPAGERSDQAARMVPTRRGAGEPATGFAPAPAPASGEIRGSSLMDLKRQTSATAGTPPPAAPPAGQKKPAKSSATADQLSGAPGGVSAPVTANAIQRDAAGERRVCGTVRDDAGRALRGVTVVAADADRSATTDAIGRFCLHLPSGAHTLQLMAVGYKPARLEVTPASSEEQSVTMLAISVLDGATAAGKLEGRESAPPPSAGLAPEAESKSAPLAGHFDDTAFFSFSDSLWTWVRTAEHLHTAALASGTANSWDSAALGWDRLLPATEGKPAEIEIRSRLAECRFRAWQLGPTDKREDQAISALTSYLVRAPAGPRREEAARELDQIRNIH